MKKTLFATLVCTFALVVCASAGTRVEAKAWGKVQTYDVRTLAPALAGHVRELVALKFTFRGKDIHHLKPNWSESSLWQPDPKGHKGFTDVRVMLAQKDLAAFKSITTDSSSPAEMTVYGRVLRDFDSHYLFVQLLGRNAVVDPNGNANIGW